MSEDANLTAASPDFEPFTLRRFAGEIRDVLATPSYRVLIVAALFASVAGGFQDVVGLYMNPPEHAAVMCVDEKTSIQALDRTQPSLPMRPGQI